VRDTAPFATDPEAKMRAIRLPAPGTPEDLVIDVVPVPRPRPREALVRVHAASITRDELEWPVDRLPAIPSYEASGVVALLADDVDEVAVGDDVYALLAFDRDGAAADYVATSVDLLAPKPRTLTHTEAAAVPLAGLSAWQALFDHGGLERDGRVLILGAAGGVGHLAVQIARARGAYVIGTASAENAEWVLGLGAHEVLVNGPGSLGGLDPVDLVFDTVGGERFARAVTTVRDGGRMVSVAEPPPEGVDARYFVVEPNRDQLVELTALAEEGALRAEIDSVYPIEEAAAAFQRAMTGGKRGKVVLRVADE
jgi:NADPH:quinone reductase-like Zn-dependent oxidoreductase